MTRNLTSSAKLSFSPPKHLNARQSARKTVIKLLSPNWYQFFDNQNIRHLAQFTLNPSKLANVGLYAMVMSFCLSVRFSVACEILKAIRYAAALGDKRGLFVSTPIHLFETYVRFLIKLFQYFNTEITAECRRYFECMQFAK